MNSMPVLRWALGALGGGLVAVLAWRATRDTFSQAIFARKNHRGADVPVGVGVLIPVAVLTVVGAFSFVDAVISVAPVYEPAALHILVLCLGFSLLGLVDDVAASGDDRGFRGHVQAMLHGRLTTGGLKLLAGGVLSVTVAAQSVVGGWWRVVIAALVISLAANLGNLFDRAPGRTAKIGVLLALPLFALCDVAMRPALVGVAVVIGAVIGLLVFDLREDLMLGDAGSNVIGAVLGFGLVVSTGFVVQVIVLVVLLALNALSERVSFSSVIDGFGPLRAFDLVGRKKSG